MPLIKQIVQLGAVVLVFAGTFYFLLPKTRIYPSSWTPAVAPAYEGAYAPNDHLASIERLGSGAGIGPEDVAVDGRGRIYGGMSDGRIVRTNPDGSGAEDFADTVGRPLGLDFDNAGNLIVADAYQGLLSIAPDGTIRRLARGHGGRPFRLTDDVDVAPDGTIYFTDASDRFYLNDYVLDLLEHQPNGRLLSYDPRTDSVTAVLYPLYFANGVAVSPKGDFVLVVETGRYRVMRHWLKGPRRGESEIFIDNLPGFPDGISSDGRGTYWLALVSPRNRTIDYLLPRPTARRLLARLPRKLQPAPKPYSFVLGLDGDGNVVHNLQDPNGSFAQISSVERYGDDLYFGSLAENAIGRLPAP
jgi:sugar lactone lactonase YvrE